MSIKWLFQKDMQLVTSKFLFSVSNYVIELVTAFNLTEV